MSALPYKEFREDGWPLCPQCGQDELYSRYWFHRPECDRPAAVLLIAYGARCHKCGWDSDERER